MKRFVAVLLLGTLVLAGCGNVDDMEAQAQDVTDIETFCDNLSENVSSHAKGYLKVRSNDCELYQIWKWEGTTKMYVDTDGIPTSEDKIILKIPFDYIDTVDSAAGIH